MKKPSGRPSPAPPAVRAAGSGFHCGCVRRPPVVRHPFVEVSPRAEALAMPRRIRHEPRLRYRPFPALRPSRSRASPPRKHAVREPHSGHTGSLADQPAACALIPVASAQPPRRRSSRGRIHDGRACRRCSRTPALPARLRPSGRDRPRTAFPLRSSRRTRTSTSRSASPSLFPHPSSTISPPGRVLAPRAHPPVAGSPSTWTALCAPFSRDTRSASVAGSEWSATAREMLALDGRGVRHRRFTGARVQGRQGLPRGGKQVSGVRSPSCIRSRPEARDTWNADRPGRSAGPTPPKMLTSARALNPQRLRFPAGPIANADKSDLG